MKFTVILKTEMMVQNMGDYFNWPAFQGVHVALPSKTTEGNKRFLC